MREARRQELPMTSAEAGARTMRARSNRPEDTAGCWLKNLREDGDMVVVAGKAGVVREVFGRIDAGEGAEIVNKMG